MDVSVCVFEGVPGKGRPSFGIALTLLIVFKGMRRLRCDQVFKVRQSDVKRVKAWQGTEAQGGGIQRLRKDRIRHILRRQGMAATIG